MTARVRLCDLPVHVRGTIKAASKPRRVRLPIAHQLRPIGEAVDSIRLIIPLPPSVNAAYGNRYGPGKGRYATKALTDWREEAAAQIRAATTNRISGRYSLAIYIPEKMRGDADNRVKMVSDLLVTLGLTDDDRFCCSVLVERSWAVPAKEALVVVKSVAEVKI